MCEGLVALLMDRADYHKFMMRSMARDLLASLVFRPIMQHMTPYNINKVCTCQQRVTHLWHYHSVLAIFASIIIFHARCGVARREHMVTLAELPLVMAHKIVIIACPGLLSGRQQMSVNIDRGH